MEKIKLLLYCTKQPPYLYHKIEHFPDTMNTIDLGYDLLNYRNSRVYNDETGKFLGWENLKEYYKNNALNGKIVAECDFEVEEITPYQYQVNYYEGQTGYKTKTLTFEELLKRSCLTFEKLDKYLYCDIGYAIHIKKLNIFDKPRELWHYENQKIRVIKEAPQNMMYAYEILTGAKYILISIRAEWLCKILNSEKTIEVRKKVLKEMMQNA